MTLSEMDRVHQQHWMLKVLFDGNFKAPVESALEEGMQVLDSGCGKSLTVESYQLSPLTYSIPYYRTCHLDSRVGQHVSEIYFPWHRYLF